MNTKTMNTKRNAVLLRTALAVVLILGTSMIALAQQPRGGEQFTANLVDPAGHFGRFRSGGFHSGGFPSNTAPVVIHIDHYTSDVEVGQLKDILQKKGPDALRDALWDEEAGYIRVGGGLGYPIAAARSHPTDNGGRVIRLMLDRPISQREVINNTRTVDYPFGYIEFTLDASGKGEGQFFAAAKVGIKGDTVEVESYSPQPLKLLGVKAR